MKKALAREDQLTREAAGTSGKDPQPQVKRQPTVPIIDDDDHSSMPSSLTRQTTQNTFSSGPSQHDTGPAALIRQPTIPDVLAVIDRPEGPSRSTTQSSARSNDSYGSDAPLIGAAGGMGYGPSRNFSKPPPLRSASERSMPYGHSLMSRKLTASSQSTQQSYDTAYSSRPPQGRRTPSGVPRGPSRQNTEISGYTPPFSRQGSQIPASSLRTQIPVQEYELRTQSPNGILHRPSNGQYVAYKPNAQAATSLERPATTTTPTRNFTVPNQLPPNDYFSQQPLPLQRSGTAPLPPTRSGTAPPPQAVPYNDSIYESYEQRPRLLIPARPATAGPQGALSGQRRPPRRY